MDFIEFIEEKLRGSYDDDELIDIVEQMYPAEVGLREYFPMSELDEQIEGTATEILEQTEDVWLGDDYFYMDDDGAISCSEQEMVDYYTDNLHAIAEYVAENYTEMDLPPDLETELDNFNK